MSRPHHYTFVHQALPTVCFGMPDKVLTILSGTGAHEFLEELWGKTYELVSEGERLSFAGLSCSVYPFRRGRIAIITLPRAEVVTEAHFVALVVTPGPQRFLFFRSASEVQFFTLELTEEEDGKQGNVLCEWQLSPQHRFHHNYGVGIENLDPREFSRLVRKTVLHGTEPEMGVGLPV